MLLVVWVFGSCRMGDVMLMLWWGIRGSGGDHRGGGIGRMGAMRTVRWYYYGVVVVVVVGDYGHDDEEVWKKCCETERWLAVVASAATAVDSRLR